MLPGPGAGSSAEAQPAAVARRGNRRRLLVFAATFVAALVIGQIWNFSRAPEYLAQTRLQATLPEVGRAGRSASSAYDNKLQLLNSRPLLARLADALLAQGVPAAKLGDDPAGRLQAMLQVRPVAGTEVVEVQATGPDPGLLADALNALPGVVRQELASRQAGEADAQLQAARQELARLDRTAAERRARLENFRQHAGVLAERDDNEAVAQLKRVNQALNVAVEKESAAEARLRAIREAAAQGKVSTQVRADPTLTVLETRASQLREELKELERGWTPDFLAKDPQARAMRSRLAELERQIAEQRVVSQQAALQSAQEDFDSARAQVERLREQARVARPELLKTTQRMGEAKVYEEDLAQVDKARRDLLERVTRLEADEQRRVAGVAVIEAAVVPGAPARPDRVRDAVIVLVAATLLALATTGVVELFNRPPAPEVAPSTTVVLSPDWQAARRALPDAADRPAPLPSPIDAYAALPAPLHLLEQPEAAALLAACAGPARLVCAAGLMGLSIPEALALRTQDFDSDRLQLQIGGAWARQLPMPAWLPQTLAPGLPADEPILRDGAGNPWSQADIASAIVSAALDAGLPQTAALDWEALRNTCIDWLVAQGVRYSELPRLVGRVDTAALHALAARHAQAARADGGTPDFLMPALRLQPAA